MRRGKSMVAIAHHNNIFTIYSEFHIHPLHCSVPLLHFPFQNLEEYSFGFLFYQSSSIMSLSHFPTWFIKTLKNVWKPFNSIWKSGLHCRISISPWWTLELLTELTNTYFWIRKSPKYAFHHVNTKQISAPLPPPAFLLGSFSKYSQTRLFDSMKSYSGMRTIQLQYIQDNFHFCPTCLKTLC